MLNLIQNIFSSKGLGLSGSKKLKLNLERTKVAQLSMRALSSELAKDIKQFNKKRNYEAVHHCRALTDHIKLSYQLVEHALDLLYLARNLRLNQPCKNRIGKRLGSIKLLSGNILSRVDASMRVMNDEENPKLFEDYESFRTSINDFHQTVKDTIPVFLENNSPKKA